MTGHRIPLWKKKSFLKFFSLNIFYHVPYTGVTLSNLLHIFCNSHSANTKNVNVTHLKNNKLHYIVYKIGTEKTAQEQLTVDQLCFLCHLKASSRVKDKATLIHKSRKSKCRILWQKFAKVRKKEICIVSFFVLVASILHA